MKTIPSDYETIDLNTFEDSTCSPQIEEEFSGIKIQGPEKVFLGENMILPVCGTWQFNGEFINQFDSLEYEITLVAVNMKTHQPYSTNMLEDGFQPSIRKKYLGSPEELQDISRTGWFNADLFFYIPELPREETQYTIYALIGDVKSNSIQVDVAKP